MRQWQATVRRKIERRRLCSDCLRLMMSASLTTRDDCTKRFNSVSFLLWLSSVPTQLFLFTAEYGIRYSCVSGLYSFFFFFQAEDGIRDSSVTGVQTCALPI